MPGKEFERGQDPMTTLGLGAYEKVFRDTSAPFNFSQGGSYSFDAYGKKNWRDIIMYLKDQGYSPGEVEQVLRSKLMRWASDRAGEYGNVTLQDFIDFNESSLENKGKTEVEDLLDEFGPFISEEAGAAPAGFTGAGSNPGMGNAQPAGTAAMTGSQQSGSSAIGSGDKWDSSIGPVHTQAKTVQEKLNEMNINPHDKLGVAMAQKMGIPLPFKKGKGDKDVEQKIIDEDPDLSSEVVTFEDWAKKFVNEGLDSDILRNG